jgi:predicted DNA-binding transcriptional regulator AlpA
MHNVQRTALSRTAMAPGAMAAIAPVPIAPTGAPASATAGADDMMTLAAACAFFGGDRPLNPSTLYRGIKAQRYPPPVRVGPNSSRWLRSECHAARRKLIEARDADTSTVAGAAARARAAATSAVLPGAQRPFAGDEP